MRPRPQLALASTEHSVLKKGEILAIIFTYMLCHIFYFQANDIYVTQASMLKSQVVTHVVPQVESHLLHQDLTTH